MGGLEPVPLAVAYISAADLRSASHHHSLPSPDETLEALWVNSDLSRTRESFACQAGRIIVRGERKGSRQSVRLSPTPVLLLTEAGCPDGTNSTLHAERAAARRHMLERDTEPLTIAGEELPYAGEIVLARAGPDSGLAQREAEQFAERATAALGSLGAGHTITLRPVQVY